MKNHSVFDILRKKYMSHIVAISVIYIIGAAYFNHSLWQGLIYTLTTLFLIFVISRLFCEEDEISINSASSAYMNFAFFLTFFIAFITYIDKEAIHSDMGAGTFVYIAGSITLLFFSRIGVIISKTEENKYGWFFAQTIALLILVATVLSAVMYLIW